MRESHLGRAANLEEEILFGLNIHDRAAKEEARVFRALQRAAKEGSELAVSEANQAYARAQLLTNAHKRALAILTDELGYVPKRVKVAEPDKGGSNRHHSAREI